MVCAMKCNNISDLCHETAGHVWKDLMEECI